MSQPDVLKTLSEPRLFTSEFIKFYRLFKFLVLYTTFLITASPHFGYKTISKPIKQKMINRKTFNNNVNDGMSTNGNELSLLYFLKINLQNDFGIVGILILLM